MDKKTKERKLAGVIIVIVIIATALILISAISNVISEAIHLVIRFPYILCTTDIVAVRCMILYLGAMTTKLRLIDSRISMLAFNQSLAFVRVPGCN